MLGILFGFVSFLEQPKKEEKGVIPLVPPPFVEAKALSIAKEELAFPEDEAGIAAYVNVGQSIDIEKVTTIFDQIEEVSETHTIGLVPIPNYGGKFHPHLHVDTIHLHLYVDTNGWIVAYFTKDEPASLIMDWPDNNKGDKDDPKIKEIKTTTLEQAIKKACDASGIDYKEIEPKIKYYDFEFPEANSMLLFVKTRATYGSNYVHISIPDNYKLYEASYYHYAYDNYRTFLKIDGKTVSDSDGGKVLITGSFDIEKDFSVGQPHTLEIYYCYRGYDDSGSAGFAVVLIYKSP